MKASWFWLLKLMVDFIELKERKDMAKNKKKYSKSLKKELDKAVEELKEVDEALKKENKKRSSATKNKVHYKIFKVEIDESGKSNKKTLKKFWAKDDKAAYAFLKKWKKQNAGKYNVDECYYSTTGYYIGNKLDENGNVKHYDSLDEMIEGDKNGLSLCKKIAEALVCPFEVLWHKIAFFVYGAKNLSYYAKNKHSMNEHWSLDMHILDDLRFNIPKLLNDRVSTPTRFYEEARMTTHKDEKNFDFEKSLKDNPMFSDEETSLAEKLWNSQLEKLLLDIKLYDFYSNFGIPRYENEPDFYETWKNTLPYKPGTLKELDFAKLRALENKHWNAIWNWIKENGRDLWD